MSTPSCLLCSSADCAVTWQVAYDDIWAAYSQRWGVDLPNEVREPYDRLGTADLHQCGNCGLSFFWPAIPGGPEFYGAITGHVPYVEGRWEFDEVLGSLEGHERLVDFGSGLGTFPRLAAEHADEVIGCDHNPEAQATPHVGYQLLNASFHEVADALEGSCDVATAFHVLEHLEDPDELCLPAVRVLRAGARLFLSTPDDERTARRTFEELDCPPHHLSRWSARQYELLGESYDLELVGVKHEPFVLGSSAIRRIIPDGILQMAALLRRAPRDGLQSPGGKRVGSAPDRWPRGTSILAEYRKR